MKYLIYQTTNLKNNKIYIGKHQTNDPDDGYLGSGKNLRRAIKKYGIENFKREILFQFQTEDEMNAKEAELVTEEFCSRKDTYNLCPGGQGGFGFINSSGLNNKNHTHDHLSEKYLAWRQKNKEFHNSICRRNAKIARAKLGNTHKGNSYTLGMVCINDGFTNRKIKKEEKIPIGWKRGMLKNMDRKSKALTGSATGF